MTGTKHATTSSSKPARQHVAGSRAAVRNNGRLLLASAKAQADGFNQLARIGQEYLAFVSHRLDQDRSLMTELSTLRDPADLPTVWTEFLSKAQREYASEAQRLMDLYAAGVRAASSDLRHRVEESGAAVGKAD